jgi:hypothetical protein
MYQALIAECHRRQEDNEVGIEFSTGALREHSLEEEVLLEWTKIVESETWYLPPRSLPLIVFHGMLENVNKIRQFDPSLTSNSVCCNRPDYCLDYSSYRWKDSTSEIPGVSCSSQSPPGGPSPSNVCFHPPKDETLDKQQKPG